MKVLKQGTPIVLNGECGACHTEVETNTAEADKIPVPIRGGERKDAYSVRCPTCGSGISVGYQWLERSTRRLL